MKFYSIGVTLSAILVVAYALPISQDRDETTSVEPPPVKRGDGDQGEVATSKSPCSQLEEKCRNNGGKVDNADGQQGNMTQQDNTIPQMSARCQQIQQQCGGQEGSLPGKMTGSPRQTMSSSSSTTQPTQPAMKQEILS